MFFPPSNPYLADPDVCLMLEFKEGNVASFEILMQKFYPKILNFIYRYTGQKQSAEDLAQEVFIKVYHAVSTYQPKAQFKTWIYTIARNVTLNELRRGKNMFVSLEAKTSDEETESVRQMADTQGTLPGEDLIQDEMITVVKEAIASLPEQQRIAVILRRYENFSYEEIALTMKVSVPAVKSLLNRAKESLKIKLSSWVKTEVIK